MLIPFSLDRWPSGWYDQLYRNYAMDNRPCVAIAVNVVESNELLSVHLSFGSIWKWKQITINKSQFNVSNSMYSIQKKIERNVPKLTGSSLDLTFGRWCSNRLADRPCHFAMMSVTVAVSFGQVQLMCLNNERHRLMHVRVAMMEALAVDEATIVRTLMLLLEYYRCCCWHYYCFHSLCCLTFDLTKLGLAVVVYATGKCFWSISVRLDYVRICRRWAKLIFSKSCIESKGKEINFECNYMALTGSNGVLLELFAKY